MEASERPPGMCILHSKRVEVLLQDQRRRDVRQPEIQVHHTSHGIHGLSEGDGTGWNSDRTEETRDFWSQLSVPRLCEDWGDCGVKVTDNYPDTHGGLGRLRV